jgi:hypothetical protein
MFTDPISHPKVKICRNEKPPMMVNQQLPVSRILSADKWRGGGLLIAFLGPS